MVTIDKAGRVVIPKEVRERLDLAPNTELELEIDGEAIRIERRPESSRRLAWTDDGRPYFPAVPGRVVTDADVQQLRDADQR
jgi:AbrB family looped-hinge helix DNA binding protein